MNTARDEDGVKRIKRRKAYNFNEVTAHSIVNFNIVAINLTAASLLIGCEELPVGVYNVLIGLWTRVRGLCWHLRNSLN